MFFCLLECLISIKRVGEGVDGELFIKYFQGYFIFLIICLYVFCGNFYLYSSLNLNYYNINLYINIIFIVMIYGRCTLTGQGLW